MSRNIIVASAAGNRAKTFVSSSTTWGELKAEIGALYNDGLEAIESVNKTTLSRDEAVLPEGTFNVFLVAKKNKAGVTLTESLYKEIEKSVNSYNVDREDVNQVLAAVKSTINTFFFGTTAASTSGLSSAEEAALAQARAL